MITDDAPGYFVVACELRGVRPCRRDQAQQALEIAVAFDGVRQPVEHLLAARGVIDLERREARSQCDC